MDSHWARLGDKVKIRYVEEVEYVDPDTGTAYASVEDVPAWANYVERPVKYRDVEYEVAALVTVPSAFSYRYYGADEFVLNDQTFIQDSGTSDVMYYAFDTTDEANSAMEEFLRDYTENVNPQFDYESKALYASEFEGMRSMFQLCGGALSFIVGLVGVLNFFNAIRTGIIARKREFAVLQSIGMTGKQLKAMLVYEGPVSYTHLDVYKRQQEERDHAMLMLQYLQNNDVPVTLEAIAKPDAELKTNMDPLKAGLAHEQYVTSLIHAIYEAAYEAKDFRTMQFLDWFVKEQGEEETNATDLIKKMELFGSDPKGLYMLDQELAARTYAAPSLTLSLIHI